MLLFIGASDLVMMERSLQNPVFIAPHLPSWIFQLIMPFLYNKQYMTRMLTNGWILDGPDSDKVLAGTALGISSSINDN